MYIRLGESPSGITIPPAPFVPVPPLKLLRVADALKAPYRCVCRIVVRAYDKPGESLGTGVLISPFHVLTCAHVIAPPESPHTGEIDVYPAQNGPDKNHSRFRANGWVKSSAWQSNNCFTAGEDFGVIRLSTSTRQGFMALRPFDPNKLLGIAANLAGYPANREERARHMYESRGGIVGALQIERCEAGEPYVQLVRPVATTRLLAHDLDTFKSQSGGPMWIDEPGRETLVALHAGPIRGDTKKAIFLNEAVQRQIQYWMTNTLPPLH